MGLAAAVVGAGALSAVGGLASSAIGAGAASSAAKTQAQAANNASATQLQMFHETQANEQPYMAAGSNALASLMAKLGLGPGGTGTGPLNAPFNPANLQNTPGYQWQFDQGEQALLNAKSATGGVGGGNTLKALVGYGRGMASTEYEQALQDYMQQQNQQFSQLQTLAGSGQNAASNLGALGSQVANGVAQNTIGAGNARAAGIVGSANALSSGISGLSSNYLLSSLLNGGGSGTVMPFGLGGNDPALAGLGTDLASLVP